MYTLPPTPALALVPLEVSRAKFDAELADWDQNATLYQRRGWVMLERAELTVTVAFLASLPLGAAAVPIVVACVRFDFSNYDLWPPSLTFLDPFTREPADPSFGALHMEEAGPRNALVPGHPTTGRAFLCIPGVREYHAHVQHSGDHWLLHRDQGQGRLAVICEILWHRMVRTIMGLQLSLQTLPPTLGGGRVDINIVQGDPDAMEAALLLQQQQAAAPSPGPVPQAGVGPVSPSSPAGQDDPAVQASS